MKNVVIHEIYHAKLISGLNIAQLESHYDELSDYHITGISPTAFIDGSDCIAEVVVLLSSGEKCNIPRSEMDLLDKYMEGKK